jgi:hypothetical protein
MSPGSNDESRLTRWTDCLPPASAIGSTVQTACGGVVQYSAITPCVIYQGKKVYFCLPLCKAVLESDPSHSCLALFSGR